MSIKLAIIGTRGIPNHYGGFEQFAEFLAKGLVERGHSVTVYNSHTHPYQKSSWNGVQIIHKKDPEDKIGTVGQFIYDFHCIRDLRNHNFEIVLQLEYNSSYIWHKLLPSNTVVINNMDGLEWKRTKYNKLTQKFLKFAEKLAAKSSDFLVADSIGIQDHLMNIHRLPSTYIPYGASVFDTPDSKILNEFNLEPESYNLVVARMEPENNIETIIHGHLKSTNKSKLLLIGNTDNKFGQYLQSIDQTGQIVFIGGVYDQTKLNNLRYYSKLYFHGHSVGGTNPSLLEAMASNSLICAHNNIFNKSILGDKAFYFDDDIDIQNLLDSNPNKNDYEKFITRNTDKITEEFSWETIITQYEELFIKAMETR